ncbi:TrhA extension/companion domain-containing protein [Oleiharenicola lentus]|uniref:TrhA extension/companion domain-containing protein n=1 Tax=Oleiharenicola lentus TaxID=2508720 RepID=UPI003F660DDB
MDSPDTHAHDSAHAHKHEEFSLPLFTVTVLLSLAGFTALLWLLAPQAVWHAQVAADWWKYLITFLSIHLLLAFIEYGFHRYVLHRPVVPFLRRFYRQHTLHHSLTRIGSRRTPGGKDLLCVENLYPMTEPHQGEAAFFPWYTFAVFTVVLTPLFVLLQWLMPSYPWFFGGLGAMTFSLVLYEVFHAIEHWPFEVWAPLVESKHFGWFWKHIYSFHLRHHAAIHSNESISGFFTLPVSDWVFGTAVFPKNLYKTGDKWEAENFTNPRPIFLIRWADRFADWVVSRRREKARA